MDSVLPKQTAAALVGSHAPKAYGSWALQLAYARTPLRTFALFSSVAALLGGAAQANYSAANSCLDALAACRRAYSIVCSSTQWGAWAEMGMAARGAARERIAAMVATSGIARIGLAQGLGALQTTVLPWAAACVGVIPVQWRRMLGRGAVPTMLRVMVGSAGQDPSANVQQTAHTISLQAVLEMVRGMAGSATVDADASLMDAGVDSLGAVELRTQAQQVVGDAALLPSTLIFDHPTARALAAALDPSTRLSIPQVWAPAAARHSHIRVLERGV
jgi:hypothetical protein